MKQQPKKQLNLIKISLLLLTALCTNVHASSNGDTSWYKNLSNNLPTLEEHTVRFAIALHSIDTSSCYDWLTDMNQQNFHKMKNLLKRQTMKIVLMGTIAFEARKEQVKIPFTWVLLSKLAIDILARLVCNTKIATILSHWPLGLAAAHLYILQHKKQEADEKPPYRIFVLTFAQLYLSSVLSSSQEIFDRNIQNFGNKIIGPQYTDMYKKLSYILPTAISLSIMAFSSLKSEIFFIYSPFIILLVKYYSVVLGYFNANSKPAPLSNDKD